MTQRTVKVRNNQHAWQECPYDAAASLEKALGSGPSKVGNPVTRDVFEPGVEWASIATSRSEASVGRQGIEP